jgi:hypothetical protein
MASAHPTRGHDEYPAAAPDPAGTKRYGG